MEKLQISAKNQVPGKIVELLPGPSDCMVKVDILEDETHHFMYSSVPVDQVDALDLKVGDHVYCIFPSASVLIGKG